ncbi:MAG: P63C domain-containing protein [Candidatus Hydrogenedentes bacterium]|nr:P63C domain-containing protein [Candidatus Hydrogenedentota bacterium]
MERIDLMKAEGKAKGGLARAAKLTSEERRQIARAAAQSRWAQAQSASDETPKALPYKGVLNLGGVKLPCAVISGKNGIQRVLTETGISKAVLGSRSGASRLRAKMMEEGGTSLPIFLAPSQLKPFIGNDLDSGPLIPIIYMDNDRLVRAYDASVLPIVCDIWLKAREAGALQRGQYPKAQKAELLTRALAQTGIVALIDEVTGYEKIRPQNALQAYLDLVIRKELAAWAKKFPDEFYENIYKLKGWQWPGMQKNRFSVVAHYTRDLVYERLGPGVLAELERKTPKNDKGNRPNALHQFLTEDIGDPMLAQHMHALLMFQRLALANGNGWQKFLQMINQVLPRRGQNLEIAFEANSSSEP